MQRISYSCLLLSFVLLPRCLPAQQSDEVVPQPIVQTNPMYPPIGRTAHIQGDVRVKVTTDGISVIGAEADSGPPLLRKASEDAARTWKFVPHRPGSFHLTFRYLLLGDQLAVPQGPGVVVVVASTPTISIYYASVGLGTWQALKRGRKGVSRFAVRLSYTGERGQWLTGDLIGTDGKCVEIDSGNIDGELIEFIVKRPIAGQKPFSTIYTGRMTDKKVVGAFVEGDVTGTWSATRADSSVADAEFTTAGCPGGGEE